MHDYPEITVGMVVLNREWVISEIIKSILAQSYPSNRVHYLIVDGGSNDGTTAKIRDGLKNLDYELVVKKSNIPVARNICIDRMKGEALVFWDSDEILPIDALEELITPIINNDADVVTISDSYTIKLKDKAEIPEAIHQFLMGNAREEKIAIDLGMGHVAISKKVLDELEFDVALNWGEDADFIFRAMEKGFRYKDVELAGLDINLDLKKSALLYSFRLKQDFSGILKKAKILGYIYLFHLNKTIFYFYQKNIREIFYMLYLASIIFFILGVFDGKMFLVILPLQLALHFIKIIKRERDLHETGMILLKSITFSMPFSYITLFYFLKFSHYKISGKEVRYSKI